MSGSSSSSSFSVSTTAQDQHRIVHAKVLYTQQSTTHNKTHQQPFTAQTGTAQSSTQPVNEDDDDDDDDGLQQDAEHDKDDKEPEPN